MTVGNRLHGGSASRALAFVAALALMIAALPLTSAFGQVDRVGVDDMDAEDNVGAALEWSQKTFDSATDAALGRDDLFPDNLASGLIQGMFDAPLLLTGSDALNQDVADELERLGVDTVHILGGTAAISEDVENELTDAGYTVVRHEGESRIQTALHIAASHAPDATTAIVSRAFGTPAGEETAAFADALAAGAWAAEEQWPILLTQTEELHDDVAAYLIASDITTVNVVGGTQAVSDEAVSEIEALGIDVNRVSGPTRTETATAIAGERGFASAADVPDGGEIIVTEGFSEDAWAPGFSAAAYAAANGAPVVLSNQDSIPEGTETWLMHDDGGSHADLICAPFVTDSACEEAADDAGLTTTAASVTLASTEAAAGDTVEATFTPAGDVSQVDVAGDAIVDEENVDFTVDEDTGTLSITVADDAALGDSTVTFTFTYDDGRTSTATATLTIIEPPTVLAGPELVSVTQRVDAGDEVSVNYTFDRETTGKTPVTGSFFLVTWDGMLIPADSVTQDDDDPNTVFAVFDADQYDSATAGAVAQNAVQDDDGNANPEDSEPLKSVTVPGGRTDEPDLLSVGNFDDTNNTADFTFDTEIEETLPANAFGLVLVDGTIESSTATAVQSDQTVVRATFGGGFNTADVRRAFVNSNAFNDGNVFQDVNVAASGVTDAGIPDLNSVAFNEEVDSEAASGATDLVDTVEFTFSEEVSDQQADLAAGQFFVYDVEGNLVTADAVDRQSGSSTTIVAEYAPGTLARVVGVVVGPGAVESTATGEQNLDQERARSDMTIDAGDSAAANPTAVTVEEGATSIDPDTGEETIDSYDIVLTFDRPIDGTPAAGDFAIYAEDNTRTVLTGSVTVDGNTVTIRTSQTDEVESAVLIGVMRQTISNPHGAFALDAETHPTSLDIDGIAE